MDDPKLKNIMNAGVPGPDDNARKRALTLALAEFDVVKVAPKKTFQGFFSQVRPMDRSNNTTRRDPMNKKLVYGGMATAMVVVLAAGVTLNQTPTAPKDIAVKVNSVAGSDGVSKRERNEGEVEQSTLQVGSALPVPAGPPVADQLKSGESYKPKNMVMSSDAVSMPSSQVVASRKMADERQVVGMMAVAPMLTEMDMIAPQQHYVGQDKFTDFEENTVMLVREAPVSTFSIDVDTSSYAFIRNQLNAGVLPQKDAIRVEEMLNYFDYDYALPEDKAAPFKPSITVTPSPWNEGRKLIHIGIKGYDIPKAEAPQSNLVFLLDTSGSMNEADKLPLLVSSLKMLLDTLKPDDHVAIVTYAGSAGTVLEPTAVQDKAKILAALDNLSAGGSTAGAEGIRQAYALARANFDKDAVNRVILATDGDFNVGITNPEELQDFVEHERKSGTFLSVLGFGQGNYNDAMMQTLAQNGNGVAAYIDTLNEARKVLVEESSSTLFPIAKDVKIQVEFNPDTIAEYRLVGYETRHLNREDFNNDAVDAGDIGAGHRVTAIYEVTPKDGPRSIDDSRYATKVNCTTTRVHATDDKNSPLVEKTICDKLTEPVGMNNSEYGFLKIRYKLPDQDVSKLITTPITTDDEKPFANTTCPPGAQCLVADRFGASDDVRFSVAVAGFGQLLKGSKFSGRLTYDDVIAQAQGAKGNDEFGYRAEFINLVRLAKAAQTLPDTQP